MIYEEAVVLPQPFGEVVDAVRAALADQGFGVLTEIDLQATLAATVGTEIDRYLILGACNPSLASRAVQTMPQIGALLPCNIVVRETDRGVIVEALDPGIMATVTENEAMASLADEARTLIGNALAALDGQTQTDPRRNQPFIENASLEIVPVENHAGQRAVRVSYDLITGPDDDLVGAEIIETIRIRGRDLHDAPVDANNEPLATGKDAFTVIEGVHTRTFERTVDRVALDVEQDWWSTGLGGETQPIAEWVDHVVAEIELTHFEQLVVQATTPVVTGSWGALGTD